MYEIVYHYHPKDKDGNYLNEIKEQLIKKVGKSYEDVLLKDCASAIMSQLARRDIWIFDVEIYEYKKTKINFKETKGGIVIKHTKFMFDGTNVVMEEVAEQAPTQMATQVPKGTSLVPATGNNTTQLMNLVQQSNPGRPVKFVTLDPEPQNVEKVKKSGLAFVVDKRYPVFKEYEHNTELGVMIYTMWDDNKREVSVRDTYFLNADQILTNGFSTSIDKASNPKLAYDTYENVPMPDVRKR